VAKRAAERGVVLRAQGGGDGSVVLADPAMLEAAVRNLLENAVAYAPAEAEVDCRIGGGRLAVTNPQVGLSDADLADVFEPFWRKDKARTAGDNGVHAGLGLSLVKAYAAAMGAQVRAELTAEKAFRVVLTFAETDVIVPSSSDTTMPADAAR
jgi:signal transduction histidine kinase